MSITGFKIKFLGQVLIHFSCEEGVGEPFEDVRYHGHDESDRNHVSLTALSEAIMLHFHCELVPVMVISHMDLR